MAETKLNFLGFLSNLLEGKLVKGIISLRALDVNSGKVAYSLVVSKDNITELVPDFPAMPANGGKVVSRFTLNSSPSVPVAVVLRPCEIRALIELVKLNQAHLENILIIGMECGGVYPYQSLITKQDIDNLLSEYRESLKKGENPAGIRPVCAGCTDFRPGLADVIVSQIGRDQPVLFFPTEKGKEVAQTLGLTLAEEMIYTPVSDALLKKRQEEKENMVKKIKEEINGLEGLVKIFDNCIACHCCSHVCPICYCKDCFFESATFDYRPTDYYALLQDKGTLKLPMDTLLFHLGRMTHMATSCVACGMCEDVCPVNIPVARIFKTVGSELQQLFDYLPGRDLEETLPLTTYKPEEFQEVET